MSASDDELNRNNREQPDPPPSIWETREGMLTEDEVRRLSEAKGKGERGASLANQKSSPGPNAQDPEKEGGMSGNQEAALED